MRLLLFTMMAAFIGAGASSQSIGHLRPIDLRCEYQKNPIGIDERSPRLTWTVESDRRNGRQTAYRILVASSAELLADDVGDLWDSGKISSDASVHIPYQGKALSSRQECWWKVRIWDREGARGAWSDPAYWEIGLLEIDDWSARWVDASRETIQPEIVHADYYAFDGSVHHDVTKQVRSRVQNGEPVVASNDALGGDPAPDVLKRLSVTYRINEVTLETDVAENGRAHLPRGRYPYLRREFTVEKPVRRARLYVTALGMYAMYLNGERASDARLAPGWTDYRERVQYQTYDVTSQIQQGDNVIGALLGPGWFAGRAGLFHAHAFYGSSPALLAQLELTYEDDTVERIVTDDTWRRRGGPILAADIMDGAMYDARAEIDDWLTPGIARGEWSPVEVRDESRVLVAQSTPPVRVVGELSAQSVTATGPDQWTIDLGQNMVGVVQIRVDCAPGTVLTLRHGEVLNADGTIYTANLRGAAATDTYICRGEGTEVWQPSFTFHGFRYVEISGLGERPAFEDVTGIVLASDLADAGTFSCSDPRLNQLQSNIEWGLRGNFVSIPTDCPQRDERMGWTGDAQVFMPTVVYNAQVGPFMTKWMTDLADAQRADGAHADVAPVMEGLSYGTPGWGDAGAIVPWTMYKMYDDLRILQRHIDRMRRWVDWSHAHSNGLIRDHARGNDYGDWLSIDAETPKELIGTAYFAHSTDILARSLAALGRTGEAARYRAIFEEIRRAYVAKYVADDGTIAGKTQTGYLLSLHFDLVQGDTRERMIDHLITDVRSRGWRLTTGFLGVGLLLPVLDDAGRADAAYRLLLQDAFPSWLYPVKHGATTIWERWNGWTPQGGPHPQWGMNSFNHYALGSCGRWFFEGVGGIRPDPAHPGFARLTIRPRITGPLTWAKSSYQSIRGEIATHWRKDGDTLHLDVTIPGNTEAEVVIPARHGSEVVESGRALEAATGVEVIGRDANGVRVRVGSGTYSFTATRPVARAGNPVFPGWYADPEVAVFGDRIWVYPTYSAPYDEQVFFDAFSTSDLVHWTKHERVLSGEQIEWAHRAMWAPSVIEKDGRYYFFFGANDIQRDEELGGIGVAVADSPSGPFKDYLGHPLIDAFHNGAQPIDQFVFRDTDGQYYLIYGGWRHCNIARLRDDFRGFEPFDDGTTFREITPEGYVEGPFMFKRDGKYYFMWSEGGWTGPDYSVAYAVGDAPTGPFKRAGTILRQDPEVATGAGHHSVLILPERDRYYIVYHRRPLGETDRNHRVVCIDRLVFNEDGSIRPVRITFEGVEELPDDAQSDTIDRP